MKLGLSQQPVAYSVLAKAVVAALVLLKIVTWSPEQVAGLLTVVDAFLGVLVFGAVKPNATADTQAAQAAQGGRDGALAEISQLHALEPATLDTTHYTAPLPPAYETASAGVKKTAPAKKAAPRKPKS